MSEVEQNRPFLDQLRDGTTGKSDEETLDVLNGVVPFGGEYEEAARTIAEERGLTLP